MQFKPWKPSGSGSVFIRFYLDGNNDIFISKKSNNLVISGGSSSQRNHVNTFLLENDIDLTTTGLRDLHSSLGEKGMLVGQKINFNNVINPGFQQSHARSRGYGLDTRTNQSIASETERHVVSSVKMLSSTRKNGYVIVDSREPRALFEKMCECQIDNVQYATLPLGDIVIGDTRNNDILLVERKTITDLSASIKSNHAHDQAERYFDEKNRMAKLGYRMKVMWLIEGEMSGDRMLYNALEKAVQMDGWINYIDVIANQNTCQSYNLNHSCYLLAKFAQGFIEQELTNKVQSGNPLINRSHKVEILNATIEDSDHGVTRAVNGLDAILSYIPSIKRNVATELSKLGLALNEVTQMSVEDLLKVKGVGKKSAQEIFDDFNKK